MNQLTAEDYYDQLCALLPPGPVWYMEQSVVAQGMLHAWAEELARLYNRTLALIEEADPRNTLELLADYERVFGLPTDCMADQVLTLEQRRAMLVSQMVSVGGQSSAYFIALAKAAGYIITITEIKPHTVMSAVNVPIYGQEWVYAWQVNGLYVDPATGNTVPTAGSGSTGGKVPLNPTQYLHVNDAVNEPLAVWDSNLLTCLIQRFKPAHTYVIFN